ncbi:MAG: hypothetical protein GXN93_04815 [Candidatus Diapherotrites archaeon]|nr:hypothetical protein [Candidatus Diapherotrites archaeon]
MNILDDAVAVFAADAQEDSSLFFGQKILAVVLAFVLIFGLYELGFVSYSLAQQVRGLMDAVVLAWVMWAFVGVIVRSQNVVQGVGIMWELMQNAIILTFPFFAVLVNVLNWNLNLLTVSPAMLLAIGAVSFIDAVLTLILEFQKSTPNSLRIVLSVFAALQSAILVFMGTYYTTAFWAGDYYGKLLSYLSYV